MKADLERFLSEECDKLIKRHFDYLHFLDDDVRRKEQRTGSAVPKIVHEPIYWSVHKCFHPFKVKSRSKTYAYTLAQKVRRGTYKTELSITHKVPKSDGTEREVNVFQIPDSALSRYVYKSLLAKNYPRFSAY